MNQKLRVTIALALGAFALSGCSVFGRGPAPVNIVQPDPKPSPSQLCQVRALAEERSSAIKTVRGAEVSGSETGQTFLQDKLKSYEARMEIAYRSMVSSCQLYANCLNQNAADETKCLRSEANYSSARSQFFDMVGEADRIVIEIEAHARRHAKKRHDRHPHVKEGREGRCKPECSTTANIFTDDCCPVVK